MGIKIKSPNGALILEAQDGADNATVVLPREPIATESHVQTKVTDATTILDSKINNTPRQIVSNVLVNSNSVTIDNIIVTKNHAVITYTGIDGDISVPVGINAEWFTDSTNSSDYYLDGEEVKLQSDDSVIASGSCVLNLVKVKIKKRSGGDFDDDNSANFVFDGLRLKTDVIKTGQTDARATVAGIDFSGSNIIIKGNDANTNEIDSEYVMGVTLYTHIKWGMTSHNKFYVEAYNPVTKEGMILYSGSGSAGHEIKHSMGVELDYFGYKNLTSAIEWRVGTRYNGGTNKYLVLNTDASIATNSGQNESTNNSIIFGTSTSCNASTDTYIAYYKCKSETFTIGTYIGTGASGNKIVTTDVNGKEVKLRDVVIKRIDDVGDWVVLDSARNDADLTLNGSGAEESRHKLNYTTGYIVIDDTSTYGGGINKLNAQYLYMGYIDTNATITPDDSYYNKPVDSSDVDATDTTTTTADYTVDTIVKDSTSGKMYKAIVDITSGDLLTNTDKFKALSTLSITDGTFITTNGIDGQGYIHSTEKFTGTIDFSGVSDGLKWVGKRGTNFVFEDKKPMNGLYTKTSADDNRLVNIDGKLYDTVGGELVVGGNFDTQADVDLINSTTGTVSLSSGKLRVTQDGSIGEAYTQYIDTIIGEEYIISCNDIGGTANGYFFPVKSDDSYYLSLGYNTTGNLSGTFIASETTARVKFRVIDGTDDYAEFDNISVYKIKPTLGTLQEPTAFLKYPVMVASETPMHIVKPMTNRTRRV